VKKLFFITIIVIVLGLFGYNWILTKGSSSVPLCGNTPKEFNLTLVEKKIVYTVRCTVEYLKASNASPEKLTSLVKVDNQKRIHVILELTNTSDQITQELQKAYNITIESITHETNRVQAWVPTENIEIIAGKDYINKIRLPVYGVTR
jgi:hypothetical protein